MNSLIDRPIALIVEDEPEIRRLICSALSSADFTCLEAANIHEANRSMIEARPHLLIVDLGLPDGDGKQFIHAVRTWSAVPTLVLSARSHERDKIEALDAGADDYLTKPFGKGELLARIRALLRRGGGGESPWFEFGEVRVDFSSRVVTRSNEVVHLTPIEYSLLSAMIAGQGKVLTHRHLLREVWGGAFVESPHYLRIYVGRLRHKLENDPARPAHFLTETGTGYRFVA